MLLSRLSRAASRLPVLVPSCSAALTLSAGGAQPSVTPAASTSGGAVPRLEGGSRGFSAAPAVEVPKEANPPYVPWTATKDLGKRKDYFKRMGFLMQTLEKEYHEKLLAEQSSKSIVKPKPGDIVKVEMVTPESDGRRAQFKGICIAVRNKGARTSFRLRASTNAGGIERTFPLFSPHLTKVEVTGARRVRRAKLYYLRDKPARESSV